MIAPRRKPCDDLPIAPGNGARRVVESDTSDAVFLPHVEPSVRQVEPVGPVEPVDQHSLPVCATITVPIGFKQKYLALTC